MSDFVSREIGAATLASRLPVASGRIAGANRSHAWIEPATGFAITLGLWLLVRDYIGVRLDSRIYLGRALADLSPATVGQDVMFRHDGQSPFSLFTPVLREMVRAFGLETASTVVSLAAALAWFGAAVALTGRLASGRLRWAMVACAAVLPSEYGGLLIIPFGEALAMPRPFAEAAVMAALAADLGRRRGLALGLLCLGALFHPIMAVAGFGVLFILMAADDRRWWLAVPVGAAALAVGTALHAPLVSRLGQRVDPAWLQLLRWRNPYLFPGLWTPATWSQSFVQLSTVALAAAVSHGRTRTVFVATVVTAVAGTAAAFVLGDLYPSLLVLQMQPWRALWLAAAAAALAAPLVAVRLRAGGPCARTALALLVLAWLAPRTPAAPALSLAAGLLYAGSRSERMRQAVGESAARTAWTLAILAAAARALMFVPAAWRFASEVPHGAANLDLLLIALGAPALVVAPLAVLACGPLRPDFARRLKRAAPAIGLCLLAWSVLRWDRTPLADAPTATDKASLARILAAHPGEIQWLDADTQAWTYADRAFWGSEIQGASIVFDRDQAMTWEGRMRRLLALKLMPPLILTPWAVPENAPPFRVKASPEALVALCRTPQGPAWEVEPLLDGAPAPALPGVSVWRPERTGYVRGDDGRWRRRSRFAVIDCAEAGAFTPPSAPKPPGPPRRA